MMIIMILMYHDDYVSCCYAVPLFCHSYVLLSINTFCFVFSCILMCCLMWYYKCLVGSDFQGAISSPTRLPTAGSRKAEEVCTWVVAR